MANKYCLLKDLHNESDVEQKFLYPLLKDLGFKDSQIMTKKNIEELVIGHGRRNENFKPDYLILIKKLPKIIVDAKHPVNDKDITKFEYQLKSYSIETNTKYADKNPLEYYIISNANNTSLYKWDEGSPIISLEFDDFEEQNDKYKDFRKLIEDIKKAKEVSAVTKLTYLPISDIKKLFVNCHNYMWKKEKISPTKAFYEFSKITFIKMKEDRKFIDKVNKGENVTADDLVFSVRWIEGNEKTAEKNPFNNILFRQIRETLEEEIVQKKKKRIFSKNDDLDLKPNTIKEVVRMLEKYDLHSIDEDLNGRMFENFLNATIRGKELGQFFTPRQVVKFMVNISDIKVNNKNEISSVLDGCCGSGGFLIEAMAVMIEKIKKRNNLTDEEKNELEELVKNKSLFGVEANPEIASVARMNMYLHGDGGSNIFSTDFLDTEVLVEEGENQERIRDVNELKDLLVNHNKQFDLILTNPPFSMKYNSKDEHEGRILKNLKMNGGSIKSNILFIIRYYDLLKDKGELVTIIDDSILNSANDRKYLNFIKEKYIIKAVISLPFNTFKNAGTSTKTSILHLRKKVTATEIQPDIFMAICNNIGHDDYGRETLDRNNLKTVIEEYRIYQKTGNSINKSVNNEDEYENLTCPLQIFTVKANALQQRLDAFYYSPILKSLKRKNNQLIHSGEKQLLDKNKYESVDAISQKEYHKIKNKKFTYVEVGSVKKNGGIENIQIEKLKDLPTRARKQVKKGDIIIAKSISCIGNNTIIPEYLDGQFVSTGFIVLRPKNIENNFFDSYVLWSYLRQDYVKKQFYYKSATAVQPEVTEGMLISEIEIPTSTNEIVLNEVVEKARQEVKITGASILEELDELIN